MLTEDIKKIIQAKYLAKDFVIDKNGSKLIEIIGSSFVADKDRIFGTPNTEYIKTELEWYKSQSLNVNDIPNTPQIWKQVSDSSGLINSNYGWCIFSEDNGSQYTNVMNALLLNKNNRRTSMIYTRPSMHYDYNKNGMSDFMCTECVDYFIRYNKLYCVVKMRSNDLRFGYLNDYAWQQYILKKLHNDLLFHYPYLNIGDIYWQASSLHLYERDFNLI